MLILFTKNKAGQDVNLPLWGPQIHQTTTDPVASPPYWYGYKTFLERIITELSRGPKIRDRLRTMDARVTTKKQMGLT
jgi:hypothetical protein